MKKERGTILLLTADSEVARQISVLSMDSGICVQHAVDGARGLACFLAGGFWAIVLDMELPVLDGVAILHEIRMRSSVPVLVLGAREEDCVLGREAGADDWLLKPFEPAQLLPRIRILSRLRARAEPGPGTMLRCGGIALSLQSHEVSLDGKQLRLTNIEFTILKCLLRSAGRVVSRDELAAVLYQREATPFERAIDVHISHVRRKLERSGSTSIRTIRGSGYLLAATGHLEPLFDDAAINEVHVAQIAC